MGDCEPTRVLLADRHPVILAGLSAILASQADLSVVGAARPGRDAVAASIALGPDVLLLDLRKPDMDGVDLVQAVREGANSVVGPPANCQRVPAHYCSQTKEIAMRTFSDRRWRWRATVSGRLSGDPGSPSER